jgi:hypothetical protein
MAFFERLTRHQQQRLVDMADRLDDHFAKECFSAHRPVSYARLGTQITDPLARREEAAFRHDELVALHSAIFDLPDIAFLGDDAIVGLAKRHAPKRLVTPDMMVASYTFMQWLGTHVGRAFIRNLDDAIKTHQAMSDEYRSAQIHHLHGLLNTYFRSPARCHQMSLNAGELGFSQGSPSRPQLPAKEHHYALLALSTYLDLQHKGNRPDTRNTFDYNMDPNNGIGAGSFYAEDDEQATAMTLVAWLGTPEGAAHLRYLDAHRVDSLAA